MSVRLGPPRIWRIILGVLALLSFAAAIPLSLLSHQAANLVIAAVRWPPIPSASTKAAGWRPSIIRSAGLTPSRA
jgi:hypothetical protein